MVDKLLIKSTIILYNKLMHVFYKVPYSLTIVLNFISMILEQDCFFFCFCFFFLVRKPFSVRLNNSFIKIPLEHSLIINLRKKLANVLRLVPS